MSEEGCIAQVRPCVCLSLSGAALAESGSGWVEGRLSSEPSSVIERGEVGHSFLHVGHAQVDVSVSPMRAR